MQVRASGGADTAEDVAAGFHMALKHLSWSDRPGATAGVAAAAPATPAAPAAPAEPSIKILLHVADAPPHGQAFHAVTLSDSYPKGDKHGRDPRQQVREMAQRGMDYYFLKINDSTDKMLEVFAAAYEGGKASEEQTFMVLDLQVQPGGPGGGGRLSGGDYEARGGPRRSGRGEERARMVIPGGPVSSSSASGYPAIEGMSIADEGVPIADEEVEEDEAADDSFADKDVRSADSAFVSRKSKKGSSVAGPASESRGGGGGILSSMKGMLSFPSPFSSSSSPMPSAPMATLSMAAPSASYARASMAAPMSYGASASASDAYSAALTSSVMNSVKRRAMKTPALPAAAAGAGGAGASAGDIPAAVPALGAGAAVASSEGK